MNFVLKNCPRTPKRQPHLLTQGLTLGVKGLNFTNLYEPIKCLARVFVRCNEAECSCYSNTSISVGIDVNIQRRIGNQGQSNPAET